MILRGSCDKNGGGVFDAITRNWETRRRRRSQTTSLFRMILRLLLLWCATQLASAEHVRELEVSEGVPVGYQIGFIGEFNHGLDSGPPYLIVPVPGSAVDSDLAIDHTTGEIRTKVLLDRETRSSYTFLNIPLSGDNIRVIIRVLDENDNAPTFPQPVMNIEFPENTPRDIKRTLNPAKDLDLGRFNTQRYNILSGNINNAFRLSSHRERDGVLYLDLQINGFLDRETTPHYSLVIEALDGGTPPLRGQMTVNITVQDVNDNQPIFNQSRYFASIPENATIGTSVLQVLATDIDSDENGLVEYSINRRQSDKDQMFRIDANTGVIEVNKPLDFETKELHELVVVARDGGMQPLETTAFISIKVTDVNDNQPTINVIFLSDDATPKISESAQPGEFVARISVNDPDSKAEYSNVNVTLNGGEGRFGLTTRDHIVYLVIISLPLDREIQSNYTMDVVATDTGNPPLHATKTIYLKVTDVNDNAPEFEKDTFYANVMEVAELGTSVIQVLARDRDEGNNSAIQYSLMTSLDTAYSNWFQIDKHSGLITTRSHIVCETEPVPKLIVIATDNGHPPLSSTATVLVTVYDVNDNEPIFDQNFYNVTVSENEPVGQCFLKVSATDSDCGVNAVVNYTVSRDYKFSNYFHMKPDSGEVCIRKLLDFEEKHSFEIPVVASDRGGLTTTTIIKVELTDVNDNRPIFYPIDYNVSLTEPLSQIQTSSPIVAVKATDLDTGRYGIISYRISGGNDASLFRIDRVTGEVYLVRHNILTNRFQQYYQLNVSASDGGGLRCSQDASIFISISDLSRRVPTFEKRRYSYYVKEDVKLSTVVGSVLALNSDSSSRATIRYSIHSGDPDGYFSIDATSGNIRIARDLDHEHKPQVLLNIQATGNDPNWSGFAQVNIEIEDVNDNVPEFETKMIKLSVPENMELNTPIYILTAVDRDSGKNGIVTYRLSGSNVDFENGFSSRNTQIPVTNLFQIDSHSGVLTLKQQLDYETSKRHIIIVTVVDSGQPSLSSNVTLIVEVQDVNDNAPEFERSVYNIKVSEALPEGSQVLQVIAEDLDTGNNARMTYRIINSEEEFANKSSTKSLSKNECKYQDVSNTFGVFPSSGWIYLHNPLDREKCDFHGIVIQAIDNGTPSKTATTKVFINVVDANDNDPIFEHNSYEFSIEENKKKGSLVGLVRATDADLDANAAIRFILLPTNTSFHIDPMSGEITTKEVLDREKKSEYDLVAEARDQGSPYRSARVNVKVIILDVNDNEPVIVDPQDDVISVREQQAAGVEVVRIRAIDKDNGKNATISYSILNTKESDGFSVFSIDPKSGIVRTKSSLLHEDRSIYKLIVAASDGGLPSKQSTRLLRVEVLDIDDNRPTFTSTSLHFKVFEDCPIGFVVGKINDDRSNFRSSSSSNSLDVTYSLTSMKTDELGLSFEIDRTTGSLVVASPLDRERQDEYQFDIRALDSSSSSNPHSTAINVRIEILDVNDNSPVWKTNPIEIQISESLQVGSVIYNFSAIDYDLRSNGEVQYKLAKQIPNHSDVFSLDPLTGSLLLMEAVDYENITSYILTVQAIDQCANISQRLTSSVSVHIQILDANDNSPVFVSPSEEDAVVLIRDSISVGQLVTRVSALDIDSGKNGQIKYSIAQGNQNELFRIDENSGNVYVAKELHDHHQLTRLSKQFITLSNELREESMTANMQRFELAIAASDSGTPLNRKTIRNIQIIVHTSKNSPPRFLESVYYVNISENIPQDSFVVRVAAKSSSSANGTNFYYEIPENSIENNFAVDKHRGIVTTKGTFDREKTDYYVIPIFVRDSGLGHIGSKSFSKKMVDVPFDVATIKVKITDVNDNSPIFHPGSCYPLSVPENNELSVIHTVVATDADEGVNGEVMYSITGGNTGNKFSIDMYTGELSARPLDREQQGKYILHITARDRGSPVGLQSSCNVTVLVEDQNDNDPQFESNSYTATVPEDIEIGTSVLKLKAIDSDIGINSRITYSLGNQTRRLFNIDNKSGLITTIGKLDREEENEYNFIVIASDGGKYDSRRSQVPVKIILSDVNDNAPVFEKHPFKVQVPSLVQPGLTLLQISAKDADIGNNGDLVYGLKNSSLSNKFRIHPNIGALSATQSLASESGKIIHLEVMASDKGNPSKSTVGIIELQIGDLESNTPLLKFRNDSYSVNLIENPNKGFPVITLNAVRTDGRRQRIQYSFGAGNDQNLFSINNWTGEIKVEQPDELDFEIYRDKHIYLTVVARTEGPDPLIGYTYVEIILQDINDNAPQFVQQHFSAAVWEGYSKGTYVLQVSAFDLDHGANSKILYHIVDGNHDNAFVIEPAFSGILKTNIVLDREIRDSYKLKVIATDEGVPQMTGTGTILINVVDVNDNQPTFPPHNVVFINEGTVVGTVVTTLRANDVDTNPPLTYQFHSDVNNDPEILQTFSIDRFSGKVVLKKSLDYEKNKEYNLKVVASDSSHIAETTLTIQITDDNDNRPVFTEPAYHTSLPEESCIAECEILVVNATDYDSENNAKIKYSLHTGLQGFRMDENSGALLVNMSKINLPLDDDIQLTVIAKDQGNPQLSSSASVRIHVQQSSIGRPSFIQTQYRSTVSEDIPCGTTVVQLSVLKHSGNELNSSYMSDQFEILSGNDDKSFEIAYPEASIVVVKPLDREKSDFYHLKLGTRDSLFGLGTSTNSTINVFVYVEDANDNYPKFKEGIYEAEVSENVNLKYSIAKIEAFDADLENSPNSEVVYDIASGNNLGVFSIDLISGVLYVNNHLDYDTSVNQFNLIIRACDSGTIPNCSLRPFLIKLLDEDDNVPRFPVNQYFEVVPENEPIGTSIFTVQAIDLDKGRYGKLNYSLVSTEEDSVSYFTINPETGVLLSNMVFDFEVRNMYNLKVKATDTGGNSATVSVKIFVESRDEFSPQFTERTYRFVIAVPSGGYLPVGYLIGHVLARDKDKGPDGRVIYQLTTQHPYLKINRTTGALLTKKKVDSNIFAFERDISLVVTAGSGRQGSLTNMTVIEIVLDTVVDANGNIVKASETVSEGLADWALGLLISLILIIMSFAIVFIFLHLRNRRHKQVIKPNLNTEPGGNTNSYVDPSAFDTIPIRGSGSGSNAQFAPPKYDEIPPYGPHTTSSNSGAATTSELSGSEQSNSSGRGSAEDGEDGEDEEIRMINEGPMPRDMGMHMDGRLSDLSIQNTQEYLARLGIIDTTGPGSTSSRHCSENIIKDPVMHHNLPIDVIYDVEHGEGDLTNLIYAKLNEVGGGSDRASSGDEAATTVGSIGAAVDHVMVGFGDVPVVGNSGMNGSLSSIVHSEEELTGSYNWDYLLDWGPQYQPLAHVFSEIARLKDDTMSIHSGNSGNSSAKSKGSLHHATMMKHIPPPLLTTVAPRSINAMPVLSSRNSHLGHGNQYMLPRSPINHDASGGFIAASAMSPSFSPNLSPLATRSPSVSPHILSVPQRAQQAQQRKNLEAEMRIRM